MANIEAEIRELLECPVCFEDMKPPVKIFQCSNGLTICEPCKNNPAVKVCPTCRVTMMHAIRNIFAENIAESALKKEGTRRNSMDTKEQEKVRPPLTAVVNIQNNNTLASSLVGSLDTEALKKIGEKWGYTLTKSSATLYQFQLWDAYCRRILVLVNIHRQNSTVLVRKPGSTVSLRI